MYFGLYNQPDIWFSRDIMQREIIQSLEKWKHKANRKPLIIQGARQVGKTWAMKHFGKRHFAKTAYINFDNNPRMKTCFGRLRHQPPVARFENRKRRGYPRPKILC